ncbi:MAG: helix-turn-helix transcriptional regulator [Kiritimatiellae bacterium]|nr:helix-turn-helix transcriptional regulator [Kiritimatiellia bacterium]
MIKSLNLQVMADALPRAGLTQAEVARRLDVSREAVSKWFRGDSAPQPDKLLRLGMLLGLTFDEMVVTPVPSAVPVVSFRRKAARRTRDVHLDNARETGELLKRLVKYLPAPPLAAAPVLKAPRTDYPYVQQVAADVRAEMGLEVEKVIQFEDLIDKFNRLHAVIVPVLWGDRQHHGNALNIHLPDSGITWVFVNLDSNAIDFKFWMAHELGHALAPTLGGEPGEDFADALAQALLFPEALASRLRERLKRSRDVGTRINMVREEASRYLISPYTMRRAIQEYERARGLESVGLGAESAFMGATRNFAKGYNTIATALLGKTRPEPRQYADIARRSFKSQFFEALAAFCGAEAGAEHFIHQVLGMSLPDAKALAEGLRQ